jgi:hypothetical protein
VRIDTATVATVKGVGRVGAVSAAGPGPRGYRKLMRDVRRGRPDAGNSSTRFMASHVRPRHPHAVGSTTMPTLPATSEAPTTMTATSADAASTRQPVTDSVADPLSQAAGACPHLRSARPGSSPTVCSTEGTTRRSTDPIARTPRPIAAPDTPPAHSVSRAPSDMLRRSSEGWEGRSTHSLRSRVRRRK